MALKFLTSSHKLEYLFLGIKYRVSPERIYCLNHEWRTPSGEKDLQIVQELKSRGMKAMM